MDLPKGAAQSRVHEASAASCSVKRLNPAWEPETTVRIEVGRDRGDGARQTNDGNQDFELERIPPPSWPYCNALVRMQLCAQSREIVISITRGSTA